MEREEAGAPGWRGLSTGLAPAKVGVFRPQRGSGDLTEERELYRGSILRKAGPSEPHLSRSKIVGPAEAAPWNIWLRKLARDEPVSAFADPSRGKSLTDHLHLNRLLLAAIAFAVGIWAYFALPEEPASFVLPVSALCASLWAFVQFRKGGVVRFAMLVAAFLLGAAAADLRTGFVAAPRISAPATFQLSGWISEISKGHRGKRLVVSVVRMKGPDYALSNGVPDHVRVNVPKDSAVDVGEFVSMRARLFPPAGPVFPGGYDFSFVVYFDGLGASGYSYGQPKVAQAEEGRPLFHVARKMLVDVRGGIRSRLEALGQDEAATALMVALLVGIRDLISEETEEDLRIAGLAHILAISGLHMALFAGGAYAAFVLVLSISPALALNYQIHRFAAVGALMAATLYLLLSGASVATQRSYVMIMLVFLGILAGRRGLTLRSVALAGLVLLLMAPESLFHPGFQMSFAAVLCLVAAYESLRNIGSSASLIGSAGQRLGQGLPRWIGTIAKWLGGLLVTSLIAGLATGIIGAHHFGRIAPYGLLGNVLGMPIFTLVVMPMGLLTLLLMPFGLASIPVWGMEWGLKLLLDIARYTSSMDGGSGIVLPPTAFTTLALFSGLFLLLFLPGRTRGISLLSIGLGVLLWVLARPADVQIAESGTVVAARDETGLMRISTTRQSLRSDMWKQQEGLAAGEPNFPKMNKDQRRCDDEGCVIKAYAPAARGRPYLIAFSKTLEGTLEDCKRADLVFTELDHAPENCGIRVYGRNDRTLTGAISLWLSAEPGVESGFVSTQVERMKNAKSVPPRPWHQ